MQKALSKDQPKQRNDYGTKRRAVIKRNLIKISIIFNYQVVDANINAKTEIYFSNLNEIPLERLDDIFQLAQQNCETFPKPAHLLKIWREVRRAYVMDSKLETTPEEDFPTAEDVAEYNTALAKMGIL